MAQESGSSTTNAPGHPSLWVIPSRIAVLLLALAACDRVPGRLLPGGIAHAISCDVPFTTVIRGATSGPVGSGLITNATDWCALWSQAHGWEQPPPPCDTTLVDFSKEAAVVLSGTVLDSCWAITITCVHRDRANDLTVLFATTHSTAMGIMCDATLHDVVQAVKVPLPVGEVTFLNDHE